MKANIETQGQAIDWSLLQVGDRLIRKEDLYLKPHHAWYGYAGYPENRRFTAGKAYQVVRVRPKSGVVLVMDDGHFRVPINSFQGRFFSIEGRVLANTAQSG